MSFLADSSAEDTYLDVCEGAFYGCTSLELVEFEDRMYDLVSEIYNPICIYDSAFAECPVLSELYLGEGVLSMEGSVFYGCAIAELTIPASCCYIGEYAFAYSENLADVYFEGFDVYGEDYEIGVDNSAFEGNPYGNRFHLDWDEDVVYGYCGEIPDGETVDLEIPDGVVGIEDGAFEGLAGLRSVYIPASVTYIGEYAFADCPDLEEIIFEEKESELVEGSWTDGEETY